MKKQLFRLIALLLALVTVLSFASCDITSLVHSMGIDLNGKGDPNFVPEDTTDVVMSDFALSYRDQLSPNEIAIFDAVAAASPGVHEFSIAIPELLELCKGRVPTQEEQDEASAKISYWIANALFAVWLDVPSLFWLETGNFSYTYNIEPHTDDVYRVGTVSLTVELREHCDNVDYMQTELTAFLTGCDLEGSNDYETLRNINRSLCDRITYEIDRHSATAYGALVERKCVCEGYAHAFQLLCQKYGITCVCVFGTGVTGDGSEGHMWNAVKLGEKWYAVDTTWNDTTESNEYFLVGRSTVSHGMKFSASHLAECTRGSSKKFALPTITSLAYDPTAR